MGHWGEVDFVESEISVNGILFSYCFLFVFHILLFTHLNEGCFRSRGILSFLNVSCECSSLFCFLLLNLSFPFCYHLHLNDQGNSQRL